MKDELTDIADALDEWAWELNTKALRDLADRVRKLANATTTTTTGTQD